jgi:hypothetical protein
MEFHAPFVLPCETASMIKTARTTISRITATGNNKWDSFKARKRPNGKIKGNAIGIM